MAKKIKTNKIVHPKQTAYDSILKALQSQLESPTNDWDKLEVETEVSKDTKHKFIKIESKQVGFAFDLKGRLLGVYNWKD